MDKETLSNYGWIVICTLILAIMIALATPFGEYVANNVQNTTQGFKDVMDKNLDIIKLGKEEPRSLISIEDFEQYSSSR